MIKTLPKEFQNLISSNNGMSQYLFSLSKGRAFTPRSWLYENKEPDKILEDWMNRLQVLENGDTFEKKVFQFDTSQLEKWGPQGGISPIQDLLKDVVEPTFAQANSPKPKGFTDHLWQDSADIVTNYLRFSGKLRGCRPSSYEHVVDDMRARDTLESNSGWPLFTRRNKPEVITASIADAESKKCYEYPAIALFRNYNQKTRLVWMFPMSVNLIEGSYTQPVMSRIIKADLPFFAPWVGFERVRNAISEAYTNGKFVQASDFSKTDEHFTWNATEWVDYVLYPLFNRAYRSDLHESLRYMQNIPLVIGPSKWMTGGHGVASGSNWTNFIETIFDFVLATYVDELTEHQHKGLYAIGDDMAWVSNSQDDAFSEYLERIGKDVGQVINAEKVTNDPDSVKTLQRLFQRGYNRQDGKCRAVYSTIRALKSSVYPERFHSPKSWNSDMFCARQYMILENCVDHPLFEDFVKFVVQGQKDLIPFAKRNSKYLDKVTRESRLLPGLNPTYNQEKRDTSLANFASIMVARNL